MSKNVGRLAYIFGNNNYYEFLPLKGAINDANIVEETLNKCGFDTYKYIDLNCDDLNNKNISV